MERHKKIFVIIACAFLLSPDLLLGASFFKATDQYQSDWSILDAPGQCILLAGGVSGGGRVSGQRVRGSRQVHGRSVQGSEQVSGGRVTGAGKVGGQKITGSRQVHGYSVQGSGQVSSGRLIGTGAEDEARQGEGQDDADKECKNLAHAIEMANLSVCVYDINCNGVSGWRRMSPEELGVRAEELEDGSFRAAVYSKYNEQEKKYEYVLSFAGTEMSSIGDWVNNGGQAMGWTMPQYRKAIDLSTSMKMRFAGEKLTITGHSLGGGLATAAGLNSDRKTIVFNPAGLHPNVAVSNNLPYHQAVSIVDVYYVEGEVLTTVQDMGPITVFVPSPIPHFVTLDGPSAPGARKPLSPDEEWLNKNIESNVLLPEGVERAFALHGMAAVLASLRQKYQQDCGEQ